MKIQLTKREKILFCMFMPIFIMMIGIVFNFLEIVENGGKMPVLASSEFSDVSTPDKHFIFYQKDEVNHFPLTDIVPFYFNGDNYKASVGDLTRGLGIISLCFFSFLFLFDIYREVQNVKTSMQSNTKKRKR